MKRKISFWNIPQMRPLFIMGFIIMLSCVLTPSILAGGGDDSGEYDDPPEPVNTSLSVTDRLEEAVLSAVLKEGVEQDHHFEYESDDEWAFGIVTLSPEVDDALSDEEQHIHADSFFSFFVAQFDAERWSVWLEYDEGFATQIQNAPDTITSEETKLAFDPVANTGNGEIGLSLPYATGESWILTQGPHGSGNENLDLASGTSTNGVSGANVRAAADGIAYRSCGGQQVIIHHQDGWQTTYYHLYSTASHIKTSGTAVKRGDIIGIEGTTYDVCGGGSTGVHLHFGIRRSGNRVAIKGHDVGGWTVGNSCLTKDGVQKCPSGTSASAVHNDGTVGSGTVPPPAPVPANTTRVNPSLSPAYSSNSCASGWVKINNAIGGSQYYTLNINADEPTPPLVNSATWQTTLSKSGRYRVEAFISRHSGFNWACPSKRMEQDTSSAHYTITHSNGSKTVVKNQLPLHDQWLTLGEYHFDSNAVVKLADESNESKFSRLISVGAVQFVLLEEDPSAPTTPGGVAASDSTHTDKVAVSWNSVSGATSYKVYRNVRDSASGRASVATVTGTSWNDTSAKAGTTYYYWVRAINSGGTSGYSRSNAGKRKLPAPSAPTNLSATDDTYTDRVRVTWRAVSGATSYKLYRGTSNSSGSATLIKTQSGTTYDDRSASAGTDYYYWVKSINSGGTSGFSGSNAGSRRSPAPSAPRNVTATDGNHVDKVIVSWGGVTGATYKLYRALQSNGSQTLLGTVSGTSYTDNDVTAGQTYYYGVKAVTSGGTSNLSQLDAGFSRVVVTEDATVNLMPDTLDASLNAGEVCLDVMVANVSNIGAFEFTLTYPTDKLTAVSVTEGEFLGSSGRSTIPIDDLGTDGVVGFAVASTGSTAEPSGDGKLAEVCFEPVAEGNAPLAFTEVQVTDADGTVIPATSTTGMIQINGCYRVDFDCDGDVDITDVQLVASRWNTVLGSVQFLQNYDINQDNRVDIVDVQAVAAEWGWSLADSTSWQLPSSTSISLFEPILSLNSAADELLAGETITVAVMIEDANDLAAFETTFSFDPTIMRVDDVTIGTLLGANGRTAVPLESNIDNANGLVSFGAISTGDESGFDGAGTLATIHLSGLGSGSSTLELVHARVTDSNAKTQPIETVSAEVASIAIPLSVSVTQTQSETAAPTMLLLTIAMLLTTTRFVYLATKK